MLRGDALCAIIGDEKRYTKTHLQKGERMKKEEVTMDKKNVLPPASIYLAEVLRLLQKIKDDQEKMQQVYTIVLKLSQKGDRRRGRSKAGAR